ncbi:MAG: hypothetical protein J2P36_09195 [Ktedonobacteraceae bacterium]|nr:hypothetical protein [Ktedonobacteraceae bacterium]
MASGDSSPCTGHHPLHPSAHPAPLLTQWKSGAATRFSESPETTHPTLQTCPHPSLVPQHVGPPLAGGRETAGPLPADLVPFAASLTPTLKYSYSPRYLSNHRTPL